MDSVVPTLACHGSHDQGTVGGHSCSWFHHVTQPSVEDPRGMFFVRIRLKSGPRSTFPADLLFPSTFSIDVCLIFIRDLDVLRSAFFPI